MYSLNLNQALTLKIADSISQRAALTFGASESVSGETTDPTFSLSEGLLFSTADNDVATLTLSNEFSGNNFISFWIKVTSGAGAGEQMIFEIPNTVLKSNKIYIYD